MRTELLDHGYLELVDSWGSDQAIVEAARMSTNKGFKGWGGAPCPECEKAGRLDERDRLFKTHEHAEAARECVCKGGGKTVGDEGLLRYMWDNAHATPFEMAGLVIEVKAPIMVFREWHRHRTQSYNEMSARYVPLPNENYCPTVERIVSGAKAAGKNRQAQGLAPLDKSAIDPWLDKLRTAYAQVEQVYQEGLAAGIPKELARLPVPVARYSRMRASANLRNWLGFMHLRCAPNAQYEIRVYAEAMARLVEAKFPRTYKLWSRS